MNATTDEKAIFLGALERASDDDRDGFLDVACGGDAELKHRVEQLLVAHGQANNFLGGHSSADETLAECPTPLGTLIGPYKLLEQIGEGGMGLVFMAEQQQPLRRLVALKLVKPGMDSKQVIARFDAERQALAMMDHPHIAKVLDAGTTPTGRPYFVMELVRGLSIIEFCDQKELSVRQRLELFVQVCHAVHHAHQKGIIHRDLKPTNILVTMADSVAVPKVIDFGVAKALGQSLTAHTLHTGYAQLVGTPLYMSPEQAEFNQFGVDTRSDVYSLGVLLYELLTGTTPFDKETLRNAGWDEMRRMIREQEPPRPSARVSTLQGQALSTVSERRSMDPRRMKLALCGELDWIVMKALEKDRNQRYESASSLARDVERYLRDEPVQACPPTASYRLRKFVTKHRRVTFTVSLIAITLLLAALVSSWQAILATRAEARAAANEALMKQVAATEILQRLRAEASEREASERLLESRRHQSQAEANFETALDAVDRLLSNLAAAQTGRLPLSLSARRELLEEATAFCEAIPTENQLPAATRFHLAKIWRALAGRSNNVEQGEKWQSAAQKAEQLLSQLVLEEPQNIEYMANLAMNYRDQAECEVRYFRDVEQAEKAYRRAITILSELAQLEHFEPQWEVLVAQSQVDLSGALRRLRRQSEARDTAQSALQRLKGCPAANSYDRALALRALAAAQHELAPGQADDLFRQAVAEYRHYFRTEKEDAPLKGPYRMQLRWPDGRAVFGGILQSASKSLERQHPGEAEELLDECIDLYRSAVAEYPLSIHRNGLIDQLSMKRQRLIARLPTVPANDLAASLARLNATCEEWLTLNRERATDYPNRKPFRDALLVALTRQARYMIDTPTVPPQHSVARPLLEEAMELCQQLATDFPEEATYHDQLKSLRGMHSSIASTRQDQPQPAN